MYHVGRPGEDGYVESRAAGVGPRRAQQPHERLLVVGAARAFSVDRRGSAVARSREREDDPAAVVASRVGPLLQPARAAHHRRQVARRASSSSSIRACRTRRPRRTCGCRRNPGTEAALLLAIARHLIDNRQVQPRVRAALGELGGVPRGARGPTCRGRSKSFEAALKEEYDAVHAGVRRGRNRRPGRARSSKPPKPSPPPARRSPRTAGAPRPPDICGAGRSRAVCTCSSC